MILEADEIYFHPNDGGCATVRFEGTTEAYILLRRELKPIEHDISLGHDRIKLEVSNQGSSCYGGISRFTIYPEKIEIELNSTGATATQQNKIEIQYEVIPERRSQLRVILRAIFNGFPNFADVG